MKVNLWFARNNNDEIVSIIDDTISNEDTYSCPICSSKVIPKAIESNKMSPHFAHMDVTKCNSESMIHFWMKHKFIERGDTFKIKTNEEIEFTCKDLDVEVTFQLESGTYRPDLVIYTECGQEVIFEMANSNKKKVQDYIDKWIELDKVIVEVDIKSLHNANNVKVLNALYYKGKCFNFNKRDGGYYNTIGKLKEEMKSSGEYDAELVKKLDWFWDTVVHYDKNSIVEIESYISSLSDEVKKVAFRILENKKCSHISEDIKKYKLNVVSNYLNDINSKVDIFKEKSIRCGYKNMFIDENRYDMETWNETICLKTDLQKIISIINNHINFIYFNTRKNRYKEFTEIIKPDSLIRKVTNKMKRKYKSVGSLSLDKKSVKSFNGRYFKNRKQESVDYYYYQYSLWHDEYGGFVNLDYVTEYTLSLNEEELIEYLSNMIDNTINEIDFNLRNIKCVDCNVWFGFSKEENEFYISKSFNRPKRCKICRDKRKQERKIND